MSSNIRGVRGFLIDTPEPDSIRAIRDGAILMEGDKILDCGEFERLRHLPEASGLHWQHGSGCVILPGLIDLHAHLPHYPAAARQEEELLPWLERHIFPLERDFNVAAARKLAPHFFSELARNGTTLAGLYCAVYEESCHECFLAAEKSGLRVIMGKVMMDRGTHGSLPSEKNLQTSVDESRRLIKRWHGRDDGRLEYAVSPRFAVACTKEMLAAAAALAEEYGVWVQTHLSENRVEIGRVLELFPDCPNYTSVYQQAGLLGPRTILGHCIHLEDDEVQMLAETRSIVAHCPTANLFLRSGMLPWDQYVGEGLRMGLASDVAAGPELSLWRVMRAALELQTARSFCEPTRIPSVSELFFYATLGAARALEKDAEIGSLDPGKAADILVLDLTVALPGGRVLNPDSDLDGKEILSLLIHRGGPETTLATYVRGRQVYSAPPPSLL